MFAPCMKALKMLTWPKLMACVTCLAIAIASIGFVSADCRCETASAKTASCCHRSAAKPDCCCKIAGYLNVPAVSLSLRSAVAKALVPMVTVGNSSYSVHYSFGPMVPAVEMFQPPALTIVNTVVLRI